MTFSLYNYLFVSLSQILHGLLSIKPNNYLFNFKKRILFKYILFIYLLNQTIIILFFKIVTNFWGEFKILGGNFQGSFVTS